MCIFLQVVIAMFELFQERMKSNQGIITAPALPSIKQEFKKSINRVMNYFRENGSFVDNDHLLVRILKTLPDPQGDDVRSWYYQAQDLSEGLAGIFDITNFQNSKAKIHQGLFLGGIGEILIEVSRPIAMNLRMEDWMDTDSVIVLYHPYTDFRVRPLDGLEFQRPIMGDHAVIGIDVAPSMYSIIYGNVRLPQPYIRKESSLLFTVGFCNIPVTMLCVVIWTWQCSIASSAIITAKNLLSQLNVHVSQQAMWTLLTRLMNA